MTSLDFDQEIATLRPLILDVGAFVLSRQPAAEVSTKAGDEPVTDADREANRRLIESLQAAFPQDFILGEESFVNDGSWGRYERIWFVDPIDGTREYIDGREDYSVMVGLAIGGTAVLGFVYQPRTDMFHYGGPGNGSFLEQNGKRTQLLVRDEVPIPDMTVALSRSHVPPNITEALELLQVSKTIRRGSVGIKVSLVATGAADAYIHLGKGTKAWDLCAPEAVLRGAGGSFTDATGRPFDYAKADVRNPHGIIAARCHHETLVQTLAKLTK